ncbi:tetratricopeptide repeat protein [Thermocatellispora tengchongensis]|uniref:tetratricopeptide repeat protein n=1 Tax=Thermocatellispora tengchongensis TaxID=1073253 RepID=UPI00363C40C8
MVLVTSRDQLRGLSMHGDTSHLTLGVFSPQETAELLASTLGSHRTRAEPGAAAELGRLCAHLPLALRIAIANLTLGRFDSLAAYVAELREGNRLAELRIEGDEQSAVQGTLDLSYAALRPHDRAMFRLLGLVPGADFTAEAAAALSGSAVEHAGRQLARLATAHLIHEYAPGRYRFHDLLRLYAAERAEAEESPESRQTARRRLYDWYLRSIRAAVERSHPHWARLPLPTDRTGVTAAGFDDLTSATAWLAAEHRNLVAAVQQAALSGPRQATWLLTDAMRSYFWASGRTGDWLSCARTAVTVAREEGDVPGTAAATLALADAYAFQGQCDELSLYAEALSAADKSGWKEGQSSIRNNLAGYHMRHGQLAEAVRCLRDGIKLDEQDGRSAWLGVKHVNLGMAYAQLGHLHAAFHHLTQALPLHADRDGIIATNLGEVCHLLGRFDDALRHLDRALRLLEEAGNRTVEPHCLTALTDVHCALGRYERALDFGRRALACSQEMENRLAEAMARNALGRVHDRTGHHAEAMDHHLRAVELAADDHFYVKAVALTGLANAAAGLGRAEAESFADQALRLARERSFRVVEGLALSAHADIALAAGDRATAVRQARLALEIHCETGHRLGEARTLRTLGNAADEADAVAYQKRAMRLFEELGSREAEPGH